MASLCFADLIVAHHMVEVPASEVVNPETGLVELVPASTRAATIEDVPDVRDSVAYDLAAEHFGITRCEAAFRRFTFDRTGAQIEPDPRAVAFWQNLSNITLAAKADPLPFADQAEIRQRAFGAMGEPLASDYMRATCRMIDGAADEAKFNLGVMLLAVLVPEQGA